MISILSKDAFSQFLATLQQRDESNDSPVTDHVNAIISDVQEHGDASLRRLAEKFGDPRRESFKLSDAEVAERIAACPASSQAIIRAAAENIRAFATATRAALQPVHVKQTAQGYEAGLEFVPVERVVCYVPGGRYPLPSTALMTTLTAQAAGVPEILLTSPKLSPETVFAGSLAGVSQFYELGGAQAVAAFAFGTQSIPKADMLVGPGNAYVTEAKGILQGRIGIDLLAGPSEVTIIADETADPNWVALDMLAQAEHDPNARSFLLTTSDALANAVVDKITQHRNHLKGLAPFIDESLANSGIGLFATLDDCIAACNQVAPEHLELHVSAPDDLIPALKHYGALFIGHNGCVAFGDYAAGPNHTLPTAQRARFQGGLTTMTFLRPQSWMRPIGDIQALSTLTHDFAQLEGLVAHAESARTRTTALKF